MKATKTHKRRLYPFWVQREQFEDAEGAVWSRCMVEDESQEGTVYLTYGPGIKIKLCTGIFVHEQEEHSCMVILSERPQRIPSLVWNEFQKKFGDAEDSNSEVFSVEIMELREGVPVVRMLEDFPWRRIKFEEDYTRSL